MHGGAEVDTFVSMIDGAVIIKKNDIGKILNPQYKKLIVTKPGKHLIEVQAWQCHVASHTFEIILEAGKVYVTHAIPLNRYEADIWISQYGSEEPITERIRAQKGGRCDIVIFT